jgi:hypothetical protein
MTVPWSIAVLFGCTALICSSFELRVTCISLRHKLSMSAPSSMLVRLLGCASLLCSCVVLRASFLGRRPLLSVAVRVQLLHMRLSLL